MGFLTTGHNLANTLAVLIFIARLGDIGSTYLATPTLKPTFVTHQSCRDPSQARNNRSNSELLLDLPRHRTLQFHWIDVGVGLLDLLFDFFGSLIDDRRHVVD